MSDNKIYELNIFKKINDHSKQIKCIDFNGRLNMFATYSLDGYINLYQFPTCKLINSIKISNFTSYIFNEIFLLSYPFPMIIGLANNRICSFNINGIVIGYETFDVNVELHIDKNCGIVKDFIIIDGRECSFPYFEVINKNS